MRPDTASSASSVQSHNPSPPRQAAITMEPRNALPTTFSLRRGSHQGIQGGSETAGQSPPEQDLTRTILLPTVSARAVHGECGTAAEVPRRRSTIKGPHQRSSRRSSVEDDSAPLTPSLLPSRHTSAPSSPKSTSTRSLRKSDEGSLSDDTGSQAIVSSGEEEPEISSPMADSAPQLIMPSIRMPSRRPFTQRGKGIGRMKILVAGNQGMGKTALIKSIVQLCEDIVHVDPLASSMPPPASGSSGRIKDRNNRDRSTTTEFYASTKPYPSWWSEMEDSKILRRRKSMGDAVLERNVCFVDISTSTGTQSIVEYMQQQLHCGIIASTSASGDFLGLLSGRGGALVDVILYLISNDTVKADCERIKLLSELGNVIPLISKADLRTPEQITELKDYTDITFLSALPKLPMFDTTTPSNTTRGATSPYMVSSATGPDMDTMDASLLMSPEYVQPLIPSELALLVQQIFDTDVIAYLRHSAAKKLIAWHALHPRLVTHVHSPVPSHHSQSTFASPFPSSPSNSGVIIPMGSDLSLTTSNSYALAKLADHTQREERLAQVRLSKWATDLQISLQRERERYERLARGEKAIWLVEKMGEEVHNGSFGPMDPTGALTRGVGPETVVFYKSNSYATHDPLGLLQWNETLRTRGWVAVQIVGSFGVIGGLALWFAKTWGFTSSFHDWTEGWGCNWAGHE